MCSTVEGVQMHDWDGRRCGGCPTDEGSDDVKMANNEGGLKAF